MVVALSSLFWSRGAAINSVIYSLSRCPCRRRCFALLLEYVPSMSLREALSWQVPLLASADEDATECPPLPEEEQVMPLPEGMVVTTSHGVPRRTRSVHADSPSPSSCRLPPSPLMNRSMAQTPELQTHSSDCSSGRSRGGGTISSRLAGIDLSMSSIAIAQRTCILLQVSWAA